MQAQMVYIKLEKLTHKIYLIMKKKMTSLGLFLYFSLVSINAQTPYFYYYQGEKQYLELDTEHIFVSFVDENIAKSFSSYNVKYNPMQLDIPEGKRTNNNIRYWTVLNFNERLSEESYWRKLKEIKSIGKNIITAPYFKNRNKDVVGLSNFFYVKLKESSDSILLRREAEKEHAIIMWQNEFTPLWYLLSVTDRSRFNTMEISNRFFESGLFQYATPDLIEDVKICTSDPYFGQQWGLKNSIQNGGTTVDIKVTDAWLLSTGWNVKVAVLDHGIDPTHLDLITNLDTLCFDTESLTEIRQIYGSHGTACAGIIGAIRNNSKGIAGVAPDCKLISISNTLSSNLISQERLGDGLKWARQKGADVINCSWTLSSINDYITDAISDAVTNGRGGKGCVVFFAAGNNGSSSVSYPANLPNVMSVGAINRYGNRFPTSQYGLDLDVVAPGDSIFTTGRLKGALEGHTIIDDGPDNVYFPYFRETSAAAPHVAGIAALILYIKPTLTHTQVRQVIESTCTQLSGYSYNPRPGNGLPWNSEVGHGLVNAYEAVASVVFPSITGPDSIFPSGEYRLRSGLTASWSVSSGFSLSSNTGSIITVTAGALDGRTGTLTAVVNGETVTKSIKAYNIGITTQNASVCSTAAYSLSNSNVSSLWSASTGFSVSPSSGNSTTVTAGVPDGRTGTLTADVGGIILTKSIQACNVYINGSDFVCPSGSYNLNTSQSASWSVSQGFSLYPNTGTSTTVTTGALDGRTGTLTANVGGITLTKSIQACYGVSGPAKACGLVTLSVPDKPSGATVYWTVKTGSTVVSSGNTTNSSFTATLTGNNVLNDIEGYVSYNNVNTPIQTHQVRNYTYITDNPYIAGPYTVTIPCGQNSTSQEYWLYWGVNNIHLNNENEVTYSWSGFGQTGNNRNFVPIITRDYLDSPSYIGIYCTVTKGCQSITVGFPVTVLDGCQRGIGYTIYPNPVSDILHISIDRQAVLRSLSSGKTDDTEPVSDNNSLVFDIRLYSVYGVLMRQTVIKDGTVEFDVSKLPDGVYYLHIYNGLDDRPDMYQIVVKH